MKERYLRLEYWHHVRFSDEVHFEYGPLDKLRIIRKPGKRYCPDCIQDDKEPNKKDKKRHHCLTAIGYNFKSDIYFYKVSENTNGKISQKIYIDQILEPMVKSWIDTYHDFILEKDGDLSHEQGKSNIIRI